MTFNKADKCSCCIKYEKYNNIHVHILPFHQLSSMPTIVTPLYYFLFNLRYLTTSFLKKNRANKLTIMPFDIVMIKKRGQGPTINL